MWLGDCFVNCCNHLNGVPARVFCILLILVQGGVMNYYLVKHQSPISWTWFSFDITNAGIFITSFVISRRHLKLQQAGDEQTRAFTLGWFAWVVYSVSLVARMSIAFTRFAFELEEKDFFGPNTLKTCVALASCVFIFLLMSHHDAPVGSERRRYIEDLTGTVIFDVLDTVDILEVMFHREFREMFLPGLQQTVLGVAGLNLIIPAIPLITLSMTNFGHNKLPKRMVALHKLLVVLLVNLPNLLVRLILWHGFSVGISPFMLKNIILISITVYEFYEHKQLKYEEHHPGQIEMRQTDNKEHSEEARVNGAGVSEDATGIGSYSFPMDERFYGAI